MFERFQEFVEYWCETQSRNAISARLKIDPERVDVFFQNLMVVEKGVHGGFDVRLTGPKLEERLGHCPAGTPFEVIFGQDAFSDVKDSGEGPCVEADYENGSDVLGGKYRRGTLTADLAILLTKPCGIVGQRQAITSSQDVTTCQFLILPFFARKGDKTKFVFLADFPSLGSGADQKTITSFGHIKKAETLDLGYGVAPDFNTFMGQSVSNKAA